MVAGVLRVRVRDARLGQVMAEQPVAPVQVVVVLLARVEQDAAQLLEVVDTVAPVDDRVECQPAVPDILAQLAARSGKGRSTKNGGLSTWGE